MHTLSVASTQDQLSPSQSLISRQTSCCTQFSIFAQIQDNQSIESQLPSCLPPDQPPSDQPPPCTPQIAINSGLQLHLQTHSMMASKCISKLAWSRPPSESLSSLNIILHVHLLYWIITASKYVSHFTKSWCGERPELLRSPKGCCEIQLVWLEECRNKEREYEGVPYHEEPHELCGSMNPRQKSVSNYKNCVDLWWFSRSM